MQRAGLGFERIKKKQLLPCWLLPQPPPFYPSKRASNPLPPHGRKLCVKRNAKSHGGTQFYQEVLAGRAHSLFLHYLFSSHSLAHYAAMNYCACHERKPRSIRIAIRFKYLGQDSGLELLYNENWQLDYCKVTLDESSRCIYIIFQIIVNFNFVVFLFLSQICVEGRY